MVRKQVILKGTFVLPGATRKTGDAWEQVAKDFVEFQIPFASPPVILLSLREIEAYYTQPGMFVQLQTESILVNGFELVIMSAYCSSFSNCKVDWIAIGLRSSDE